MEPLRIWRHNIPKKIYEVNIAPNMITLLAIKLWHQI